MGWRHRSDRARPPKPNRLTSEPSSQVNCMRLLFVGTIFFPGHASRRLRPSVKPKPGRLRCPGRLLLRPFPRPSSKPLPSAFPASMATRSKLQTECCSWPSLPPGHLSRPPEQAQSSPGSPRAFLKLPATQAEDPPAVFFPGHAGRRAPPDSPGTEVPLPSEMLWTRTLPLPRPDISSQCGLPRLRTPPVPDLLGKSDLPDLLGESRFQTEPVPDTRSSELFPSAASPPATDLLRFPSVSLGALSPMTEVSCRMSCPDFPAVPAPSESWTTSRSRPERSARCPGLPETIARSSGDHPAPLARSLSASLRDQGGRKLAVGLRFLVLGVFSPPAFLPAQKYSGPKLTLGSFGTNPNEGASGQSRSSHTSFLDPTKTHLNLAQGLISGPD